MQKNMEYGIWNMGNQFSGVLCALLLLFLSMIVQPVSANGFVFPRDLAIGSIGEDVRQLQIVLNKDPRTRVAESGPGSPGNETDFFGEKTRNAVITYQEMYAGDLLVQKGLTSGTGVVDPALRRRIAETAPTEEQKTVVANPPVFSTDATGAILFNDTIKNRKSFLENPSEYKEEVKILTAAEAQERNNRNAEIAMSVIEENLKNDGRSPQEIKEITAAIEAQRAVPMEELQKQFEQGRANFKIGRTPEEIEADVRSLGVPVRGIEKKSSLKNDVMKIISRLSFAPKQILAPKEAHAAVLQSVGGPILYFYICTCSYTWYIVVGGASTPGTLDYETATQAHLSYNMPYATEFLGLSTRVPVCYMYVGYVCTIIPTTYGVLSYYVGSNSI